MEKETDASMSDNLLRISRTTSKVMISNCLPIELGKRFGDCTYQFVDFIGQEYRKGSVQ